LAEQVCLIATIVASFQEASRVLQDRGVHIDAKTICEITRRYARRAEPVKQDSAVLQNESLAGCRVIISTDGGRIRIRNKKRGPKTQKGRHRYTTKWREPKLLIIYTVNELGEKVSSFLPIIEGTMKGPDAVFSLIKTSIRSICKGRKSKKLKAEKNYFERNRKRMQYSTISSLGLPIGSGAMESAIRRVVNLRLKGASIYWIEETAEAMLLLRSFYKSGRWKMINYFASSDRCIMLR
jgi:hypothetical protein